jgi:hypothetical protein
MAQIGVRTTDLEVAPQLDEVIVNYEGKTQQLPLADFIQAIMGSGALSDVLNKETRYLSMGALTAGPELAEGSLVTVLKDCYVVAAESATDADITGTFCKYYDLQRRTEFTMLYFRNTLPNLSIFTVAGRMYRINAAVALADSITKNLGNSGVAGIEAFGDMHLDHFGNTFPIDLKSGDILRGNGMFKNRTVITTDTQFLRLIGEGDGAEFRADFILLRDLGAIVDMAADDPLTASFIEVDDAAFSDMGRIFLESKNQQPAGIPALSLGNSSGDQVYSFDATHLYLRGWTDAVDIHSAGTGGTINNLSTYPASNETGTFSRANVVTPNIHLIKGQGFIRWIQRDNGVMEQGLLSGRSYERIEVGEVGIEITGDPVTGNASSACKYVDIEDCRFKGGMIFGWGMLFDRDKGGEVREVFCDDPDDIPSGGLWYKVTANCDDRHIRMDLDSARAVFEVEAGAKRHVRTVIGPIPRSSLAGLAVSDHCVTIVEGGLSEVDGVHLEHKYGKWNYERLSNLPDDTVHALSPPDNRGIVRIKHDTETDDDGVVSFYIGSTPSAEALEAGTNFEVIVAAGTTAPTEAAAVNNKTTIYINEAGMWFIHKNGNGDDLDVFYSDA